MWLVSAPLALAGMNTAHTLANGLVGAPVGGAELLESGRTGASLLPLLGAVAVALVLAGLACRATSRLQVGGGARSLALPFALVAPFGFVALELIEGATRFGLGAFRELAHPASATGLALQVPFALAGYAVAWLVLRAGEGIRSLLERRRPPLRGAAQRSPVFARPTGESPRSADVLAVSRGRAPPPAPPPELRSESGGVGSPSPPLLERRSMFDPVQPARARAPRIARALSAFAAVVLLAAVGGLALAAGPPSVAAPAESVAASAGHAGHLAAGDLSGAGYWAEVAGAAFHSDGVTRTTYLGADELVWDYAPSGRNGITGKPFDGVADTFVRSGPGRIGSRYLKCIYRAYTDATFTKLALRSPDDAYLGLLGPVIRAEVGDTIRVVFRNACPFPASVHPHGVLYDKSSEGASYADGTSGARKADDAVPQGDRHTYTWEVPERAGPGPADGSSVMWMYHSHTDEVADTYAGLMGPIEITRKGMARADGSPKDVDREVFELYAVMNEGGSPLLRASLHRFARKPAPRDLDDEGFQESNLMHSINGYVFGNQPLMTIRKREHVRWYVMSMGTEVDLHTPHWHGNVVTAGGMRMDVVSLLPASMVVADMVPDAVGTWLFHCHVNDHITAGMLTRYRVTA